MGVKRTAGVVARATAVAALCLTAMGWQSPASGNAAAPAQVDPSLGTGYLTTEGSDQFALTVTGSSDDPVVTVAAPATNTGANTRLAFWLQADGISRHQQSCATFEGSHAGIRQPGIALRIRNVDGRTRAITVTKNIIFGAGWGFNIHGMDSAANPAFTGLAGFDLSSVFRDGDYAVPYPWRMCARVVAGTVGFKVWPLTHAEPAWGNPSYGGSVRLPIEWSRSVGHPGLYMGHLAAGESFQFSNLVAGPVAPVVGAPATVVRTPPL